VKADPTVLRSFAGQISLFANDPKLVRCLFLIAEKQPRFLARYFASDHPVWNATNDEKVTLLGTALMTDKGMLLFAPVATFENDFVEQCRRDLQEHPYLVWAVPTELQDPQFWHSVALYSDPECIPSAYLNCHLVDTVMRRVRDDMTKWSEEKRWERRLHPRFLRDQRPFVFEELVMCLIRKPQDVSYLPDSILEDPLFWNLYAKALLGQIPWNLYPDHITRHGDDVRPRVIPYFLQLLEEVERKRRPAEYTVAILALYPAISSTPALSELAAKLTPSIRPHVFAEALARMSIQLSIQFPMKANKEAPTAVKELITKEVYEQALEKGMSLETLVGFFLYKGTEKGIPFHNGEVHPFPYPKGGETAFYARMLTADDTEWYSVSRIMKKIPLNFSILKSLPKERITYEMCALAAQTNPYALITCIPPEMREEKLWLLACEKPSPYLFKAVHYIEPTLFTRQLCARICAYPDANPAMFPKASFKGILLAEFARFHAATPEQRQHVQEWSILSRTIQRNPFRVISIANNKCTIRVEVLTVDKGWAQQHNVFTMTSAFSAPAFVDLLLLVRKVSTLPPERDPDPERKKSYELYFWDWLADTVDRCRELCREFLPQGLETQLIAARMDDWPAHLWTKNVRQVVASQIASTHCFLPELASLIASYY
jgi:hypothetical protein